MIESVESAQGASNPQRQSDPTGGDGAASPDREAERSAAPEAEGQAPERAAAPEEAEDEAAERSAAAEVGFEPAASVSERNAFNHNTIVVGGDFIGSLDGEGRKRRSAVPVIDITASVGTLNEEFVESVSFQPTVAAIEQRRMALLVGGGCGNRITAAVALHRTGHRPIVELPGALAVPDLVETIEQACRSKGAAGVLVESVDPETLTSLAGFQLRHLQSVLPPEAAVVFTTRAQRHLAMDPELPAIEGVAPDSEEMVDVLARRSGLGDGDRKRCHEAQALLAQPLGPATVAELVALAPAAKSAADLAATVNGQSPVLEEWLDGSPRAHELAAVATAACLDGLPICDFDTAAESLTALLRGEVEPPSEAPPFETRERLWPAGLVHHRPGQAMTYFGWQETEVVEICPPHRQDAVIAYLWRHLGGRFRRPFLRWLLELPASSNNWLAYAAARAAGVLFACDPLTAERELLRPWALDGSADLRNAAGFALGIPLMIGADPTGARRLVKQWSRSNSNRLRAAAIAAYGGPLGVWDPSTAAASHLWDVAWGRPELQPLADASLASLFAGGREAERSRATTTALLGAVDARIEAQRAYAILPLVFAELTSGGRRARESLEALLEESERETFASLAALLARAFDDKDGRESARGAMRNVLYATTRGRIGRGVVERLIREMKAAAGERGRLTQLGSQLRQFLKAEDRESDRLRDVARSLDEMFYAQAQGGKSSEIK